MSSSTLGLIDTTFLSAYSLGLFISGYLGDHLNPKHLLNVSYICVALVVSSISLVTCVGESNPMLYCVLFALNGALQSIGWPTCSAIFVNWFGKSGRGAIIGIW